LTIAARHFLIIDKTDNPTPDQGRQDMPITGNYVFIVSMDVAADKEDLFNEVYDKEHVPLLNDVPGVVSVSRSKMVPLSIMLGGEKKTIVMEGEPTYQAIYEIDSPDVLMSDAWAKAGETGRWPTEVRPHTTNRSHVLRKVMKD
jgi:hypothetical protein